MTEVIRIWTLEDTKKAIEKGQSGIEASLIKWYNIRDGLDKIYYQSKKLCGLCIEKSRFDQGCFKCPIRPEQDDECCSSSKSIFERTIAIIHNAYIATNTMISTLEKVKRKINEDEANHRQILEEAQNETERKRQIAELKERLTGLEGCGPRPPSDYMEKPSTTE